MFTHRSIAIATLAAAIATGPAFADPLRTAVEHFNRDIDRQNERIVYDGPTGHTVTVSAMEGASVATALTHFNRSVDRPNDRIGRAGVTLVPSEPAYGADIFAEMREMDDD
jgi:hypothetical protein